MEKQTKWLIAACLLASVTIALLAAPVPPQGPDASWWLGMGAQRQRAYVWGYMMGYERGHWSGCGDAIDSLPPGTSAADRNSARAGCDPKLRGAKDDLLVKEVTEFYKRYADDREVALPDLLEQLLKGLTPEQAHDYPFIRRSHAAAKPSTE
jgi:hypothetical protein